MIKKTIKEVSIVEISVSNHSEHKLVVSIKMEENNYQIATINSKLFELIGINLLIDEKTTMADTKVITFKPFSRLGSVIDQFFEFFKAEIVNGSFVSAEDIRKTYYE